MDIEIKHSRLTILHTKVPTSGQVSHYLQNKGVKGLSKGCKRGAKGVSKEIKGLSKGFQRGAKGVPKGCQRSV